MLDQIRRADVARWRGKASWGYNNMKMIINENPQKYYYGQTNPLKSENPCPLPSPAEYRRNRALTAYDLLKASPELKVTRTQKEVQECSRPQFDHPKILHILIDRAAGYGCKKLAAAHGGSTGTISKFLKSMCFDRIKPHEVIDKSNKLTSDEVYDREWIKEVRSMAKDVTWARHPEVAKYVASKKYYADPKSHNEKCKRWRLNNKEKVNERMRQYMPRYYQKNPSARIADTLRSRMVNAINAQQAGKKASAVQDLGCSIEFFMQYIEARFKDGMTWGNRGLYGWHFDHIKPCASFDLTKKSEQKKCFHYTNYQPLWAEDNLVKSDKQDEQLNLL